MLQPSHLHFTQKEERKKGRPFLIRIFLDCCAQYFCLHPVVRNIVTWPQRGGYMAIRKPRKCHLCIRWPDSQLKMSNSRFKTKERSNVEYATVPASPGSSGHFQTQVTFELSPNVSD